VDFALAGDMDARFQEGDDSESPRRKDDGQALLRACLENDWKKAETLIKAGSFLGARCEAGRTPLMHACLKGKETVVQLLIDKGADPQVMDKRGDTCLHFLETLRNQTILQCILNEYQALGVSVDVESLVNTLHTNDIIVLLHHIYYSIVSVHPSQYPAYMELLIQPSYF
jgi:ankyrin repeat protein